MTKRDHNYAREDMMEIVSRWKEISAGSISIPELGAKRANSLVIQLGEELIRQGKDNQLITRIMRLGTWMTPALLEYINGEGEYSKSRPILQVVLKNKTSIPIEVETDVKNHNGVDLEGNETSAFYVSEVISETVKPGETITVTSHFAVNNLYNRCRESWFVAGQRTGYKHADELEEVGYTAQIGSKIYQFPSADRSKK